MTRFENDEVQPGDQKRNEGRNHTVRMRRPCHEPTSKLLTLQAGGIGHYDNTARYIRDAFKFHGAFNNRNSRHLIVAETRSRRKWVSSPHGEASTVWKRTGGIGAADGGQKISEWRLPAGHRPHIN
jgi:hypothetical protein